MRMAEVQAGAPAGSTQPLLPPGAPGMRGRRASAPGSARCTARGRRGRTRAARTSCPPPCPSTGRWRTARPASRRRVGGGCGGGASSGGWAAGQGDKRAGARCRRPVSPGVLPGPLTRRARRLAVPGARWGGCRRLAAAGRAAARLLCSAGPCHGQGMAGGAAGALIKRRRDIESGVRPPLCSFRCAPGLPGPHKRHKLASAWRRRAA